MIDNCNTIMLIERGFAEYVCQRDRQIQEAERNRILNETLSSDTSSQDVGDGSNMSSSNKKVVKTKRKSRNRRSRI